MIRCSQYNKYNDTTYYIYQFFFLFFGTTVVTLISIFYRFIMYLPTYLPTYIGTYFVGIRYLSHTNWYQSSFYSRTNCKPTLSRRVDKLDSKQRMSRGAIKIENPEYDCRISSSIVGSRVKLQNFQYSCPLPYLEVPCYLIIWYILREPQVHTAPLSGALYV